MITKVPARHGMTRSIFEHDFDYGRCDRRALAEQLTGRSTAPRPEMQRLPSLLGTEVTHVFMDELRPVTDVVEAEPLTYRVSVETLRGVQ